MNLDLISYLALNLARYTSCLIYGDLYESNVYIYIFRFISEQIVSTW